MKILKTGFDTLLFYFPPTFRWKIKIYQTPKFPEDYIILILIVFNKAEFKKKCFGMAAHMGFIYKILI